MIFLSENCPHVSHSRCCYNHQWIKRLYAIQKIEHWKNLKWIIRYNNPKLVMFGCQKITHIEPLSNKWKNYISVIYCGDNKVYQKFIWRQNNLFYFIYYLKNTKYSSSIKCWEILYISSIKITSDLTTNIYNLKRCQYNTHRAFK